MTGQNHYKVLGVSPEASPLEIRAAYVHLLKRHHPDRAGPDEGAENSIEVQRIVGAYRILKDPASRAKYDAAMRQLTVFKPRFRRERKRVKPELARAWTFDRTRKRFKLDTEMISYALMFLAAAAGLQLLVSRILQTGSSHSPRVAAGASQVRELAAHLPLEVAVRNAGMMSGPEASNYSSRCFAAARRDRNPAAADQCVGFDMAYVYWRETMGGPLVMDPYFQPEAMGSRARNAFNRLSPADAMARVQSLRAATLSAIMQSPRPTDGFAPHSGNRAASVNDGAGGQPTGD